ncbi:MULTISPECIES: choice-of-anchor A family protein [unclassified Streptomyces]|uniref:choice-of-anchor A family protein n=1 Tax=unclassified Streptomyces TaxID=2593676 RepID=UPI000363EAEE|nr:MULTISPECIES: choice-of-anchor A family protein [unclassified Streptomyces]MYS34292.1 choice-of-anchor A family protein [Streptomyces sp. SID4920]MYX68543.1 choice-of-anchor A family protein [Streptomyces sp. SID8373]
MKRTSAVAATACLLCLAATAAPATADYSGNPLTGDNGFGVLVQDDAVLGSTETEGSVAIGGNLTYGPGYNVALHTPGTFTAPGDDRPTALLVGGRIDHAASSPQGVLQVLSEGYVKVGDPTGSSILDQDSNNAEVNTHIVPAGAGYDSTPRIQETVHQPTASVTDTTGLPDLDALFATFRDRSDAIDTCSANVILRDAEGDPLPDQTGFPAGTAAHVRLTEGETNVLRLTGEQLNNLSEITFDNQPTATTPFVVDVDTTGTGGAYTWHIPNLAGVSGDQAPYMLWNFPDATDITIADGDSLEGTIYAPRAHLTDLDASNIEGTIVVRQLTAGPLGDDGTAVDAGEIHQFPFAADIDCDGPGPSPSPTPSPTDPTPTPTPTDPTPTPTPTDPTPTPTDSTPTPTPTPTPTAPTPTPTPTGPTPTPSPTGSTPGPHPTHSMPMPHPTDCPPTPTPSPTDSTPGPHPTRSMPMPPPDHGGYHHRPPGGGLADTGTATTLYAAAGAFALATAGIFLLGRRRRPRH